MRNMEAAFLSARHRDIAFLPKTPIIAARALGLHGLFASWSRLASTLFSMNGIDDDLDDGFVDYFDPPGGDDFDDVTDLFAAASRGT